MNTAQTHRFSGRHSDFGAVRAFIDSTCASMPKDARHRLVLLVEELFCNSVNHGYGGESDQPIWLTLSMGNDVCRLVYEDCAPAHDPFDASKDPMLEAGIEDRPIGGLGVFLLMEFSRSHRYERRADRNVIELEVPWSGDS
jgi:anti-sigma regulatory factor (Ser/Thr protein kinase)